MSTEHSQPQPEPAGQTLSDHMTEEEYAASRPTVDAEVSNHHRPIDRMTEEEYAASRPQPKTADEEPTTQEES